MELVQREIQQWRRDRPHMGEMPAPLWEKATAVARKFGVYRTSKALRLNYGVLKQRVMPSGPRRTRRVRRAVRPLVPSRAEFLEVSNVPLVRSHSSEGTSVEVVGTDGARLIVRLAGAGAGFRRRSRLRWLRKDRVMPCVKLQCDHHCTLGRKRRVTYFFKLMIFSNSDFH